MSPIRSLRVALVAAGVALAAGCQPQQTGNFDFQDSWLGELSQQTYAVGADVEVIIYGPSGFDMNFTKARSISLDGDRGASRAVEITTNTAYPEFGCVVAEGNAQVDGEGRIAVVGKLGGTLDFVDVTTDTVDQVAFGRSLDYYSGQLGETDLGDTVNVLQGGWTNVSIAPLNDDGVVLAGQLPVQATSGASVDVWGNQMDIYGEGPGRVDFELGEFSRSIDIAMVQSSEVVEMRLDQVELGQRGDMDYVSGEHGYLVTGITASGAQVLGLDATWRVDGYDYGSGDRLILWDDSHGRVCWNNLCEDF